MRRIKTCMSLILLRNNIVVHRKMVNLNETIDLDKEKEKYNADKVIYKPFYEVLD